MRGDGEEMRQVATDEHYLLHDSAGDKAKLDLGFLHENPGISRG